MNVENNSSALVYSAHSDDVGDRYSVASMIIVEVAVVFAFLTLFFFTYIINIEEEEFEEQINFILDDILENNDFGDISTVKQFINKGAYNKLIVREGIGWVVNVAAQRNIDISKKQNASIQKNNGAIKVKAYTMVIVAVSVSVLFLISMVYFKHVNWQRILLYVFITLAFVALTEFTFLTAITKQYRSVDPNIVQKSISKAISAWVEKNKPNSP